jgi:hypothetical protein
LYFIGIFPCSHVSGTKQKTQMYFVLHSFKISRLVFLQNNGIQVAVVTLAQGQRYPKNTPKQTLFHIKQNKINMDKCTTTSDLQHLAYIYGTSFRYLRDATQPTAEISFQT